MKNTDQLGLTLPEGSDYVNIEMLNENWRKIDNAVMGLSTEDAALRNLIGERAQIVHGSYVGDDEASKTLEFPFEPKLVVLQSVSSGGDICVCVRGARITAGSAGYGGSGNNLPLAWEGNTLTTTATTYENYNRINTTYLYIAIG